MEGEIVTLYDIQDGDIFLSIDEWNNEWYVDKLFQRHGLSAILLNYSKGNTFGRLFKNQNAVDDKFLKSTKVKLISRCKQD